LPADTAVVNIVDFGYLPAVTRIHIGQTVIWSNGGREQHDVTGDDDWHSGPIESPMDYRHTFGFAGSFTYTCSVHRDMHGTIIVSP
jgi:plastocyanin